MVRFFGNLPDLKCLVHAGPYSKHTNGFACSEDSHRTLTFEEAATSLLDPQALAQKDADSEGEARWVLIGMSTSARLLTIVYMLRDENRIRVISKQNVTRKEVGYYA
jgi:uncharacterized protein